MQMYDIHKPAASTCHWGVPLLVVEMQHGRDGDITHREAAAFVEKEREIGTVNLFKWEIANSERVSSREHSHSAGG